jgi:dipeptidyl aminopeptidase/acylaminoacyl peptidase
VESAPEAASEATAASAAPQGLVVDGTAVSRPAGWQPEDPRLHPLSIERMRGLSYPGSDLTVVRDLEAGSNYRRQVVSYESEGHTIYGLFTVPNGEKPASGWPVVIFNHGYIPPAQYRTTERYVAYQDAFARAGYITLKSDYRGHGSSEGESTSGRSSPAYTIDVLNGMEAVLRHPEADPNRVGMWGHSMGGGITLRAMVVSNKIKAGVIWAGVVASYQDMFNRLGNNQGAGTNPNPNATPNRRGWRFDLVERFGPPSENPAAWDAVSPNAFLGQISGPLQLHHGTNDHSVPVVYSERLQAQMEAAGRPSETFIYDGDDHNLSRSLRTALNRSVEFFDRHVKGAAGGG